MVKAAFRLLFVALGTFSFDCVNAQNTPPNTSKLTRTKDTTILKEVVVRSPLERYRDDSADRAQIYHKILQDARRKVKLYPTLGLDSLHKPTIGIAYEGLLSKWARKLSGKYKKDKAFEQQFTVDEAEKRTWVRYNDQLIKRAIPHLSEDSVSMLLLKYPVSIAFSNDAGQLELIMWARSSYRDWLKISDSSQVAATSVNKTIYRD